MYQPSLFSSWAGITNDGEKEEYVNEANSLEELDLFIPMLKLMEKQGNQDEKLLNAEISNLIGKRLHDFDIMGAEVCDVCVCSSIVATLWGQDWVALGNGGMGQEDGVCMPVWGTPV